MRQRRVIGPGIGLLLVLLAAVGLVAAYTAAGPQSGPPAPRGKEHQPDARPSVAADCRQLITPDKVGPEEYDRHRLAERLKQDDFVAWQLPGYIVCSQSQPEQNDEPFPYLNETYYLFDQRTGELAVTNLVWEGQPARPAPTPTPLPTVDPEDITTVCFDTATPLVDTGGDNPQQWTVWDLLSKSPCAVEMSAAFCWYCDEDLPWRWLVPVATGEEAQALAAMEVGPGTACVGPGTAAQISGHELGQEGKDRIDHGRCSLELGGDRVCWHCSSPPPEPTTASEPAASPTRESEPQCADYLTPDSIGQEAWETYGIAGRLHNNEISATLPGHPDSLTCYGERMINGAWVVGDRLHYRFDIESGEILLERIHWREDLPEHLPSPVISQQEAAAMIQGEVRSAELIMLGPDSHRLTVPKASHLALCWAVVSYEDRERAIARTTVIDAITGEVLGHVTPH